MENLIEERSHGTRNILFSLLLGGLVGAVTMLLFAPQSGKQTRAEIQLKSIQLRDQTTKKVKKAIAQVRSETNKVTTEVRHKAGELKQVGQDKLVKQLDRLSDALDTGKTASETA